MASFEINGQRECASNQRRTFCNNFPINIYKRFYFNQAAELSQADVPFFKSSLIKTKYKTDESGKSVHFANQNNLKLRKNTPNKTKASN